MPQRAATHLPAILAAALDGERRCIATELHDHAGPTLAAVALKLSLLETRLAAGACAAQVIALAAEARKLLSEAIADLRDVSAQMRPARLEHAGLLPALHDAFARFRRLGDAELSWTAPAELAAAQFSPEEQWLVYRTVQEALNNCLKHAGARHVEVALDCDAGALRLRIADDGVGFDPQSLPKSVSVPGLGLLVMRERVEDAGGRFELQSRPGAGTRIEATLPRLPL